MTRRWFVIGLLAVALVLLLPRLTSDVTSNFVTIQLLRSALGQGYSESLQRERLQWAEATLFGSHGTQRLSSSRYYRLLGQVSLEQGNLAKAEEYLIRTIALDSKDRIAHLRLGDTYESLGQHNKAVDEWRLAGAGSRKAGEAMSYSKRGMYDAAVRTYEYALEIDPYLEGAYHGLAWTYTQQSKFEKAADVWRRALTARPQWSEPYTQLGSLLYWQLSSRSEGLAVLEECVRVVINPSGCYYYLGRANQDRGDFAAAIRFFLISTQLSPTSGDAWAALGEVYYQLGQYEKAAEMYDRASSVGNHPVWRWLGSLGAGRAFLASGDHSRATERLQNALAAAQRQRVGLPYLSEILIALGQVYEARGDFEQATRVYERTLERDPGNLEAQSALARLRSKR